MKSYLKEKTIRLKGKKYRELMEAVLERDGCCQNPYCESGYPIDIPHHIKYKSRGGSDTEGNLITLCVHCHLKVHYTAQLKVTGIYPDIEFTIIKK